MNRWILVCALMGALACGGDDDGAVCIPGETIACLCSGSAAGVQTCLADGTGLGACNCAPIPGTDGGMPFGDGGFVCGSSSCAGCCLGNTCVAGNAEDACGAGGVTCDGCGGSERCSAGRCEPIVTRCDPSTCSGCCSGNTCLGGSSSTACGSAGRMCVDCGPEAACRGGVCEPLVTRCDSSTCSGCCSGDTCLGGSSSTACGSAGRMCVDCGPDRLCRSGACALDPASRWDVRVLSLTMNATDTTGDAWDAFGGAPDPFVRATALSALAGRTATRSDVFTATYNQTVLSNLRADALAPMLRFDVFDEDVSSDDFVGACVYTNLPDGVFGGPVQTLDCGRNIATDNAGFTLRWQLVRN